MHKIEDKLNEVRSRIREAALDADRNPDDITLLAVSKTQQAGKIRQAYDAGQRDFGENYVQEALEKIEQLRDLDINWHFIGPIQSNKTRSISNHFDWVHSVDRLKIAQRLSEQRPDSCSPLNVCIQVNIDNEATKSGVPAGEVRELVTLISELPRIRLRGLMAIPAPDAAAPDAIKNPFLRLKKLFEDLKTDPRLADMDTLSMGMSADMEAAIASGSTIVRIGTAVFGERG